MATELSNIQRRQLVDRFLKEAFPPNGIGMGVARMDELGNAFKLKPNNGAARTAVSTFLKAVDAKASEATKGNMVRLLEAAFE